MTHDPATKGHSGSGFLAVYRHELRLILFAPLCAIFQIGFLVSFAACVFLVANFYATDEASLRLMGVFMPWVALILVPALAMRMWPHEHGERTVELLLSMPVRSTALVFGKYLAAYTVLLLSLLFTAPFALTVLYLGDPDIGVMVAAYVAGALLLALYLAVSSASAALVREPIGAFVVSLALLFVMVLLGWDVFARFLKDMVSTSLIDTLALFGPLYWMKRMGQGLVDVGGVFYFLSLTCALLWMTERLINAHKRSGSRAYAIIPAVIVIGLIGTLIPRAADMPGQIDLTESGEYSLHSGTRQILDKVPAGTEVTLYWSESETSVPASIKSHARRIRTLLQSMATFSDGRLAVKVRDPIADSEDELAASGRGMRQVPMSSGDHFFLGLSVTDGTRIGSIPYLDIRRDQLTEYDIALALNGLVGKVIPKIGLLSPHIPSSAALGPLEGMAFVDELKQAYDVAVIPHFKEALPDGLDVLIVIDATIMRKKMLYAIDQFVMGGGSLIMMMDPFLRFNRASNTLNPVPSDTINDISDLLLRYGVKYESDIVVGDRAAASVVSISGDQRMSYPFWMRIRDTGFSQNHPITAGLNEVFIVEGGAFRILDGARVTPLIVTSGDSGTTDRTAFAESSPQALALAMQTDGQQRTMAVAIEDVRSSAFDGPLAGIQNTNHVAVAIRPAIVLAVADVDWLFDPFAMQATDIGGRMIVRPLNDNLTMLLNMVEYAAGESALIGIRSRGQIQRPFTRVQALFQQAERALRAEEATLVQRTSEIEQEIQSVLAQSQVEDVSALPQDIKEAVLAYRDDLLNARRALRDIRLRIRKDVDSLGQALTAINLVSGPLLVGLFWLIMHWWRRRVARRFLSRP